MRRNRWWVASIVRGALNGAAPRDRGALPAPVPPPAADEVEPRLLTILAMVTDWLKYAEAKASGLVALSGTAASVLAFVAYEAYAQPASGARTVLLAGVLGGEVLVCLSLVDALVSFFPQTEVAKLLAQAKREAPAEADNLYNFGHLGKYAPAPLAEAVARRYAGDALITVLLAVLVVGLRSR